MSFFPTQSQRPMTTRPATVTARPFGGDKISGTTTKLFWRDRVTKTWQYDSYYYFFLHPNSEADRRTLERLRKRAQYIMRNGAEIREEAYHVSDPTGMNPFAIRVTFVNKTEREFEFTATNRLNGMQQGFTIRKKATTAVEMYEPATGKPSIFGTWLEGGLGGFFGGGGGSLGLFNNTVKHLDTFVVTKQGTKFVFNRQ